MFRADKVNRLYKIAMARIRAEYKVVTRKYRNARLLGFEEHQQTLDEAQLARLTERGAKAWRDVPGASAWVDGLPRPSCWRKGSMCPGSRTDRGRD